MKCALIMLPSLLLGCNTHLPGEPVGTYEVVMELAENTCGPQAAIIQDGNRYSVELREDRGRGYWHIADRALMSGTLNAEHAFEFTISNLVAPEGPDAGANGCTLVQDEELSGSLIAPPTEVGSDADGDPHAKPSELVGEHVLRLSTYAETDCSRALQAAGGKFEALPCTIRYSLKGTARDSL